MQWNELAGGLRLTGQPNLYLCEKGWRWHRAAFVDFDLWVVLGGEGEVTTDGGTCRVGRGDGFLFRRGDSVRAHHNPLRPLKVFAVHFEVEEAGARWLERKVRRRVRINDMFRFETLVTELAQRALVEDMKDGEAEVQLAALLADVGRDSLRRRLDPVEEKLRGLCLEIGSNPTASWDGEALARQAGLSLSQFNRRFRSFTGLSPARYLIARRIDRAKKLLRETPMTLQEIAEALGYSDIYYFHRQFRAETGETPNAVRRDAEGN